MAADIHDNRGRRVKSIGIDFGTSTTLVATDQGGGLAEIVPVGRTGRWLPSVVGFDAHGDLIAGEDAEELPRSAIARSVKLALTRGESKVTTASGSVIAVEDAVRSLLRTAMERSLESGTDVATSRKVQLGCPAMWSADQRQLLVSLARECGINADISHVVDEPIAAGVAWIEEVLIASGKRVDTKVLVFDPGGGTLDVAVIRARISQGSEPEITVLGAGGIAESGDALDRAIAEDLRQNEGLSGLVASDPVAFDLLVDRSCEVKELLSTAGKARRPLGGGYSQVVDYQRSRLDQAFAPQLSRAKGLVMSVVRSAKLREELSLTTTDLRQLDWDLVADEIDAVVLVGGMSQVPRVKAWMTELFPKAHLNLVQNPQHAVVRGLALADRYERLNLHRPAFDFRLRFFDADNRAVGEPITLYRAFSPLYEWWHVFQKAKNLGFQPDAVPVPRGVSTAALQCVTVDDEVLPLALGDEELSGLPVVVYPDQKVKFKLYVDGRIAFGANTDYVVRVQSWPTLRGGDHDRRILLTSPPGATPPSIQLDEWRFIH